MDYTRERTRKAPCESGRESRVESSRVAQHQQEPVKFDGFKFLVQFFFPIPFPRFSAVFAPPFIFDSPARAVPPVPVFSLHCLAQSSLRCWSLHSTPTTANRQPPRPIGKGLSRVSLWCGSSLWPAHRQQLFEGTFLIVRITDPKGSRVPLLPVLRLACRV